MRDTLAVQFDEYRRINGEALNLSSWWMALWLAYLLWRSRHFDGTRRQKTLWLWGWGVLAQLLVGLGLFGMAARAALGG